MHRLTIDTVSRVTISSDPFGISVAVQLTDQTSKTRTSDTSSRLRNIFAEWLLWPGLPEISQLIEALSSPDTPALAHHIVPAGTSPYMNSFCLMGDDGIQSIVIEHRTTHERRITCSLEASSDGTPALRLFLEGPRPIHNRCFCSLIDLIPTAH